MQIVLKLLATFRQQQIEMLGEDVALKKIEVMLPLAIYKEKWQTDKVLVVKKWKICAF